MKLWSLLRCPVCGFTGCTAPFEGTPCPMCGFRVADPGQPPTAVLEWAKARSAGSGRRSAVATLHQRRSRAA